MLKSFGMSSNNKTILLAPFCNNFENLFFKILTSLLKVFLLLNLKSKPGEIPASMETFLDLENSQKFLKVI